VEEGSDSHPICFSNTRRDRRAAGILDYATGAAVRAALDGDGL